MKEWRKALYILAVFLAMFHLPVTDERFSNALIEALALAREYAREHVLLCLIPALFIAGAICVFVNNDSVTKYFGAQAKKALSYGVASVSGMMLAVCSCTVLPLFAGIYAKGAGLGPAITFLYSAPAINVLSIVLTARVLGWRLGLARAVGAVLFSVGIGLLMHLMFRSSEKERQSEGPSFAPAERKGRTLGKDALYFAVMVVFLVFANIAPVGEGASVWYFLYRYRWVFAGSALAALLVILFRWFNAGEIKEWGRRTWSLTLQILPLLFIGVLLSGFLLGRPGHEGLVPSGFVAKLVGGNSLSANFFSSIVGGLMYFATLTEVPILQSLLGAGMGEGPALALLLSGPALSLPSILVIRSVIGMRRTAVYITLVVAMATVSGMLFGALF